MLSWDLSARMRLPARGLRNFPLMLTLIAMLTFLLLVRAFRSLLLPLK
jgi:hypothetical protein